jgi:branched-chain amino acid transport system permease protein
MASYALLLLVYTGIYAILAIGLNLIAGTTGLLSLCQAAFFGVGAYTTAILTSTFHWDFVSALGASVALSALIGLVIGLPTLRLKGDYLAIATLGFGQIVQNVIINWDSVTRGSRGISDIPPMKLFGLTLTQSDKGPFAALIWSFVLLSFLLMRRFNRSRLGRALEAIREDPVAAAAMGIDVPLYETLAFTLGSAFAGLAGWLWASYNQSVAPETFGFMLSVLVLCMVVLGGMGNPAGVLIGAVVISVASELPRLLGLSSVIPAQWNQVLFGLILVLAMVFRPQGILARRKPDFERSAERSAGEASE